MRPHKFFTPSSASEAVAWRCSVKKVFLEILQNSQENTCARVSFLIKLQVSGCEFCEISKDTFFHRTPPIAACLLATKASLLAGSLVLLLKIFFTLNIYDHLPTDVKHFLMHTINTTCCFLIYFGI